VTRDEPDGRSGASWDDTLSASPHIGCWRASRRDQRHRRGHQGGAGQADVPAPPRRRHRRPVRLATPARRRFLAQLGRRSTAQALARSDPDRRHPILLATLAETAVEILDELVSLFDQALAVADSRARHQIAERLLAQAHAETERDQLLDNLLDVLADPDVADEAVGGLLRRRLGWAGSGCAAPAGLPQRGRRATTATLSCSMPATTICGRSPRRYWPRFRWPAARTPPPCSQRSTYSASSTPPADAALPPTRPPTSSRPGGEATSTAARRAAERPTAITGSLAVLYRLQTALRSGDVWVRGSRRHADRASHLIPADRWPPLRAEFCALTGTAASAGDQMARLDTELIAALTDLEDRVRAHVLVCFLAGYLVCHLRATLAPLTLPTRRRHRGRTRSDPLVGRRPRAPRPPARPTGTASRSAAFASCSTTSARSPATGSGPPGERSSTCWPALPRRNAEPSSCSGHLSH
jgi:hypothetical protein